MPLTDATTLDRLVADSLRERRFHLSLLATFAAVALLLAAVGIYGVMSHSVSERTHELGVRVALGARASDVLGLVLRRGAGLAIAGVAIGVAGAAAVTRVLGGLLFEITPLDPTTFASGVAALVAVAMLACWLPARRATRLDPVRALRAD